MRILGLQKLTLLDYPGRLAAVLFLGGCNFRCPFCQNSPLVLTPEELPELPPDELDRFLKKRIGILDGICVTGGEPTLYRDLPTLLAKIKAYGYLVKLDTNGTNPDMLEALMSDGLIDYAAIDIKAGRKNYARVCGLDGLMGCSVDMSSTLVKANELPGRPVDVTIPLVNADELPGRSASIAGPPAGVCDLADHSSDSAASHSPDHILEKVSRSADLLCSGSIDYEFRTTVVRGLHTEEDFYDIASWLPGSHRYFLQSFRDDPGVLQKDHSFSSFSEKEMRHFLEIVQKEIPAAALRGI